MLAHKHCTVDDDLNQYQDLEHCQPAQKEAVQAITELFAVSENKLEHLINGIEQEMKRGLTQQGENDLKMIPSFIAGYPTGNEKGTYLALEMSGVDIYVCQVRLKGEDGKLAINQYQYKVPDHLTAGDDISILIDYIADCLADFQQRMGSSTDRMYPIGISIGMAVRQTGLNRGVCVALEHGFEYPNAVGTEIVDLFHQRFHLKGLAVRVVAIANDAVCTLLAHAYQHPSTRMGIVHSVGTNCAYYDKVSNMKAFLAKHTIPAGSDMIVNTEWCNFKRLPVNRFDQTLDKESNNQGIHAFEKMSTGMYLGELVRLVLMDLVEQCMLSFDVDDEACLLKVPYQFDTSYIFVCESDDQALEDTRTVLEEMCRTGSTTLADREIVKKVCEIVGRRAAVLLGASMAGVVRYMVKDGIGLDNNGFAIGKLYVLRYDL
ncbi:hexokinase-domain-containing protein [Gilbertella persicaria]|uniref:hexokinase-domain-containing protein n=1 Tax=Gilbertella persicaria TaxID=101096 RepID=UPI00221E7D18|nr:hexokinase-domain-containing protein [Gilbertella persicaria]KAI8070652.1 hexokinase-domain-containing protein [Gilbertella persicaria]